MEQEQEQNQEIKSSGTIKKRDSFVGTAEYVAPELLNDSKCLPASDLWALGCVACKMFNGKTPFFAQTEYLVFNKIKEGNFTLNQSMPPLLKDLVSKLLKV